jgi:Putative DNA-binding domain
MIRAELDRELERQQRLLQSIQSPGSGLLQGWVRPYLGNHPEPVASAKSGLAAYVAHAGATAERALVAAYPTVQALVGDETFALMARALWRQYPPSRGDLGWFGEALPAFIASDEQLTDVPYLGDVARLDWALTRAESAPDVEADLSSFQALSDADPQVLWGVLSSGATLIESKWPIVTLWRAHQQAAGEDAFGLAKQALQDDVAETAWVWRSGWKAQVQSVSAAQARFLQALSERASLSQALSEAGDDFDFALCLQQGIQQGWWAAVGRR